MRLDRDRDKIETGLRQDHGGTNIKSLKMWIYKALPRGIWADQLCTSLDTTIVIKTLLITFKMRHYSYVFIYSYK